VNRLFGETVTVSGLLGGAEVLDALRGRELGERVYLPRAMFAHPQSEGEAGGLRTLDDLTLDDFRQALGRPVVLADVLSELCDLPPLEGDVEVIS
jgi:NifB/MoaA-like Fe-S oxidoreductase